MNTKKIPTTHAPIRRRRVGAVVLTAIVTLSMTLGAGTLSAFASSAPTPTPTSSASPAPTPPPTPTSSPTPTPSSSAVPSPSVTPAPEPTQPAPEIPSPVPSSEAEPLGPVSPDESQLRVAVVRSISGTVTNAAGKAVVGIEVSVDSANFGFHATTDSKGKWALGDLRSDVYTVRVQGAGYPNLYYPNAAARVGAQQIDLRNGGVVVADMVVRAGASVSGMIWLGPDTSVGTFDGVAELRTPTGELISSASTDSGGRYSFGSVAPGPVVISYRSNSTGRNIPYYWGGSQTLAGATVINLTSGQQATGYDGHLIEGGMITGTPRNGATGEPAEGVTVTVYRKTSTGATMFLEPSSNYSTGFWTRGLPPGQYLLKFDSSPYFAEAWWKNATSLATATPVTITGTETVGGISPDLTATSSVSGSVKDQTGAPLPGVVKLVPVQGGGAQTLTTNGSFIFRQVVPGTYTLQYESVGAVAGEWWNDKRTQAEATTFVVGQSAALNGFDAVLGSLSSISGTVSAHSVASQPLAGVVVNLLDPDYGFYVQATTTTDSEGKYSFGGLATGLRYRVGFSGKVGYADEYWDNARTPMEAAVVTVAEGGTTGIDAVLDAPGTISGTVSSDDGSALGVDAYVEASAIDGDPVVVKAQVAANGTYVITGLRPGAYSVRFSGGSSTRFTDQYWHEATDPESATAVVIATDSAQGGIDAALHKGGRVTGKVTGPDGKAVSGATVEVYTVAGELASSVTSTSSGAYRSDILPETGYKIHYIAPSASGLVSEWWRDAATSSAATTVKIFAASTTIKDVVLERGGVISGTLRTPVGGLVASGSVRLVGPDAAIVATVPVVNGAYKVTGLGAGSYALAASSADLLTTWSGQKVNQADATKISVSLGQTSNYDLTMLAGGSITGSVKRSSGTVMADTVVKIISSALGTPRYIKTDSAGTFSTAALPPGQYIIYAASNGNYAGEWWSNQTTQSKATRVTVNDGKTTSGINFSLNTGGSVSGTITDPRTGSGAPGVSVRLTSTAGAQIDATTDSAGRYTARGLPFGSYTVLARGGGALVDTWLGDVSDVASARYFTINSNTAITSKNLVAVQAGSVTGFVRASTAGGIVPLGGVAVRATNGAWSTETTSRPDGSYAIGNAPPGAVSISAVPSASNPSQAPFAWDTREFSVASGSVNTLGDLYPQLASTINGTVTDKNGKAVTQGAVFLWTTEDWETWTLVKSVPIDWKGRYVVGNLQPRVYKLGFTDNPDLATWSSSGGVTFKAEYWKDKTSLASAVWVGPSEQETLTLNPVLAKK